MPTIQSDDLLLPTQAYI